MIAKPKNTLNKKRLEELYSCIQKTYLADNRPWIIGYSGGKDSTCVLQIIWHALNYLPADKVVKPIYIISSDTLVETPAVVNHIDKSLKQMAVIAQKENLPYETHKVVPELDNTYWVNMIGRGYPTPSVKFRWCTDRMKIQPTSKFILEQIKNKGEVIIVLGARRSESASRAQVMSNRRNKGKYLSRHNDLPNAWVFTPIEEWKVEEVWEYLLSVPSPWGGRNKELVTMYRNAQSGECPLVIDKTTPSCGNSRFGCWTCTVVKRDSSMEAMIEKGQEWLEPLLEFRDWMAETQDPERKKEIRDYRRRTGNIQFYKDESGTKKYIPGPYVLDFRKEILRRLLRIQKQIREEGPNPDETLISKAELLKIRQLWRFEEGDWEDSLQQIYHEETDEKLNIPQDDWSGMGGMEIQVLRQVCDKHDLELKCLTELFDAEKQQFGMSRRAGIHDKIATILNKDWRSREEVMKEIESSEEVLT